MTHENLITQCLFTCANFFVKVLKVAAFVFPWTSFIIYVSYSQPEHAINIFWTTIYCKLLKIHAIPKIFTHASSLLRILPLFEKTFFPGEGIVCEMFLQIHLCLRILIKKNLRVMCWVFKKYKMFKHFFFCQHTISISNETVGNKLLGILTSYLSNEINFLRSALVFLTDLQFAGTWSLSWNNRLLQLTTVLVWRRWDYLKQNYFEGFTI